ncbi:ABC transporter permease [bacterium]|nr:ABC transporter permease [bacterium]
MRLLQRIFFALRSITNRKRFESELNEELADFLERDTQDKIARGQTPDAAERAARVEMQGVHQTKERVRELRPGVWLETLWQDIRFAARILRKRPAYVMLALGTMALGIGANTAIFSLIHAVLLQPLPFHDPERLVLLQTQTLEARVPQISYLNFADVRDQHPGIEEATLFLYDAFVMKSGGKGEPARRLGLRVTPGFFHTLGVQPSLGRGFHEKETVPGKDRVAVVSHRLWKESFGSSTGVLGKLIVLDEQPYIIVGVLPKEFDLFLPMTDSFTIQNTDIYIPLPDSHEYLPLRSIFTFEAIARLRKNVTQEQAEADILHISRRLAEKYPDTNGDRSLVMTPLRDHVVGGARPALYLLMAAVVAVLLVACANLANLMIGRVTAREQELAICAALGASRGRLIRRLLVESMLMTGMGGFAGVVLAWLLLPQITERLASQIPGAAATSLNAPVLLYAILACLLTAIVSGLLPARRLISGGRASVLANGEGRASAGTARARMRKGLVVTEIALSCVLLAGAILLGSSFLSLMRVRTGFDSTELLTFQIRLSESRYETRKQVAQTANEFAQRIAALPGVKKATATGSLPLSGHNTGTAMWIEGRMPPAGRQPPELRWQFVQPGYFETMRIPLVRGRLFEPRDLEHKTHVTLISESVAQRDFPNENPIGKRVSYGAPETETDWHEIIGVVGDVRHGTLREEPVPRVYDLLGQHAGLSLFIAVRTSQGASQIMPSVRAILSHLDPGAPVYDVRTMEQWKTNSVSREQMLAAIVTLFAGAALFLGAVGAYGVISSLVAQRTREIGIRMALGAAPKTILRSTIGEGLQLALTGLTIGVLASIAIGPMLRGLLFGVKFADPRTFALVAAPLLFVSLAACYIPARRAARVDPMTALRAE